MTASDYSKQVPAADRTLTLLESLAASPEGLTSAELLAEVDCSRSGLYALLNTLRSRGYIDSEEGRHRLGPAVRTLVPSRPEVLDELIEGFRAETAMGSFPETVAVTWPEGGGTVVVAQAQPAQLVRVVYPTGERRPSTTADGMVIDAGDPGDDETLKEVRQSGIAATESDESIEFAAPICRDGVRPVAALLVGVPTHRATPEVRTSSIRAVRRSAARLSHRLGAPVYQPYGWVAGEQVGPSRQLSSGELDDFLAGLWGAQLACIRDDGTPHVVPLWYEWDGTSMWMAASPGSSWRSFVETNPEVSVTLDEPWPPLRRVFLSGTARLVDDGSVPGGLEGLRRRLATRYLGRGADRRPELTSVEGWTAVQILPARIHGRQGLGSMSLETAS